MDHISRIQKCIGIAAGLILVAVCCLYFIQGYRERQEIVHLVDRYYELVMNEAYEAALAMEHLEDDHPTYADAILGAFRSVRQTDYRLNAYEKLNPAVYGLEITMFFQRPTEDNGIEDVVSDVTAYAARIDGEWKMIMHLRDLPEDLMQNITIEYDPDDLGKEKIIFKE